ncbi:putative profilin [Dioscorea sansibarensis]
MQFKPGELTAIVNDLNEPVKTWCCYSWEESGVTVKKANQALIFGVYDEPMTPGQCNMIVERMGNCLTDQGL